jgi:hypothetical protein
MKERLAGPGDRPDDSIEPRMPFKKVVLSKDAGMESDGLKNKATQACLYGRLLYGPSK